LALGAHPAADTAASRRWRWWGDARGLAVIVLRQIGGSNCVKGFAVGVEIAARHAKRRRHMLNPPAAP